MKADEAVMEHVSVSIPVGGAVLKGDLSVPSAPQGVVLFAHGSGSSRLSPRNQYVAAVLNQHALGTLLIDLLTAEEEREDKFSGHLRFNIELLTDRLVSSMDWLMSPAQGSGQGIGLFGASTGAAAALMAAAQRPNIVKAVVSRGFGRIDCIAGSSSDPADCRGQGHSRDGNESRCDGPDEVQDRTQDGSGSNASVRGAGRPGTGGKLGCGLVYDLSRTCKPAADAS